jgi:hypothetical protein
MEQTKRSAVTNVTANGSFNGQYGTLYKFEVSFANGDSGEYASKSQDQQKFKVGQEVDYSISDRRVGDKIYFNIKPVAPQPQAFKAKDPDTDKRITRMSVLKVAGDLVINGDIELKEILAYAQVFEKFVVDGHDTLAQFKPVMTKKSTSGIIDNFRNDAIRQMENDQLPF